MIHPSVYSFNAPYRGPKQSKEVNKLFTSIIYDVSIVYDEMETQASKLPNNLRFCVTSDTLPWMKFPTAGLIGSAGSNGVNFYYKGTAKLSQDINKARMRIDQILENL